MNNEMIAQRLMAYAGELESEGATLYRVRAFRRAAETVRSLPGPIAQIAAEKGRAGLEELPGIGASLAYTIEFLIRTGELHTLRPVDVHHEPYRHLTSLPGVGIRLAEKLYTALGVTTVDGLDQAVQAGRLEQLGLKPRQMRNLLQSLRERQQPFRCAEAVHGEPSVEVLLGVDLAYREKVAHNEVPRLSPRRFNPEREVWLPIFALEREGWHFRALYSNTSLAHRLGKTRDWVVIYFQDGGSASGQRTVVTETKGDLEGKRVIRGRERECRAYYHSPCVSPSEPEPAA